MIVIKKMVFCPNKSRERLTSGLTMISAFIESNLTAAVQQRTLIQQRQASSFLQFSTFNQVFVCLRQHIFMGSDGRAPYT
jgi:hypothetical protein